MTPSTAKTWPPDHHKWTKAGSIARLSELRGLEDGWLDGEGIAPGSERVGELIRLMDTMCPDAMPQPLIAPTPEGGISFEWYFGGSSAGGEIILSRMIMTYLGSSSDPGDGGGYEEVIDLTVQAGWERLARLLEARPTHDNYISL